MCKLDHNLNRTIAYDEAEQEGPALAPPGVSPKKSRTKSMDTQPDKPFIKSTPPSYTQEYLSEIEDEQGGITPQFLF